MRVTRELRLKGLTHDDIFVRGGVLDTFKCQPDSGVDVTKAAIAAIARYGWQEAFEWPHMIAELPQDHETVEWVFQQLAQRSFRGPNTNNCLHLAGWFSKAPVDLVRPNLDRLTAAFQGRDTTQFAMSLADFVQAARERIRLASETDDQCLSRLDELFTACSEAEAFPKTTIARAHRVCERLASTKNRDRVAKLVFEWLSFESDLEGDIGDWRAGIAIHLAGLLGLQESVPRLLEMFDSDWDWWNEEIEGALRAMGGETVLSLIIDEFEDLPDHGRLYSSGVFMDARVPGMEDRLTALLEREGDFMVRINLGKALALYGTSTSIDTALQVYRELAGDPDVFGIASTLYAFYRILGAGDEAQLRRWRATLQSFYDKDKMRKAALN